MLTLAGRTKDCRVEAVQAAPNAQATKPPHLVEQATYYLFLLGDFTAGHRIG